jgi:hypothetical protein
MHVFHIRGLSSFFVLLLAIVATLMVFLLLPASFMMVLWNALVFETFKGPEINLYQGFLLWGVMLVALKLIFKPEIQLEFVKANAKEGKSSVIIEEKPESEKTLPEETPPKKS